MTAIILDGIVLGLQFGLLAAGMTLVYGLGGVLNLAYGQMAVISAMAVLFTIDAGVSVPTAVGIGLVTGGVVGFLFDRTILRPIYRRHGEARVLLSLLLTLGVAFMVDGFLNWRYPVAALSLNISGDPIELFGLPMRRGSIVGSAIILAVFALLFVFLRGTAVGRAVRSIIEDEEGARLVGIDPSKMLRFILILSGVLAAVVALTQSMIRPVTVTAGFSITVFALIVTVVGGLGSVAGAFLAGIILGVINSLATTYIGTFLSLIILLGAAAVTILIRPSGLLGIRE
ncbi:MAG: hypothetical protein GEU79_00050 [Acidimicrobiia bacterium]|nr:hypothetical protein [Acidimicrobiia bacterium]